MIILHNLLVFLLMQVFDFKILDNFPLKRAAHRFTVSCELTTRKTLPDINYMRTKKKDFRSENRHNKVKNHKKESFASASN
jgi:hypothetical protein